MKFGVRECVDVVFKAKSKIKIGNSIFQKDEPVIYLETAKTSTLEQAATTVYAQGGAGNPRLIAWEGEKTLTFTVEDALMSPLGFAVLSGAGLVRAGENDVHLHVHQTLQAFADVTATGIEIDATDQLYVGQDAAGKAVYQTVCVGYPTSIFGFMLNSTGDIIGRLREGTFVETNAADFADTGKKILKFKFPNDIALVEGDSVLALVDFYVVKNSGAFQMDITPDKFAGFFYVEASTLFRRQSDGVDLPAEFVIPNVKIQSNFTFTMASTGDPSTFTFTMDAFPDYTKWDKTKKVLAMLQVIEEGTGTDVVGTIAQTIEGTSSVGDRVHTDSGSDIANA